MLQATDDLAGTDVPHGAPVASIVVLGRSGLLREVVAHHISQGGRNLIDLPLLESSNAEAVVVVVLVEPSESDWKTAHALHAEIVVVADVDDRAVVDLVVRGADAVITPDSALDQLTTAIEVVASGGSMLPPGPARRVLRHLRSTAGRWRATLTPRERDILESIERGESIKQTARTLGISEKTVQNLQSRLFSKLRARNRAQAITRAHELHLL
jgi:DNA-binding NarL/FixJ family response regulator